MCAEAKQSKKLLKRIAFIAWIKVISSKEVRECVFRHVYVCVCGWLRVLCAPTGT